MTPEQFIAKWKNASLNESQAAQEHFIDLCRLLGEPTPGEADPGGEWFCFEKGATMTTGGEGWADVWKRGHFGWEYKGKKKSLDDALDQLKRYALALENPPLLIVCNLDHFRIVTNWTNAVSHRHDLTLEDLREPTKLRLLKWAFSEPERLRPGLTRRTVTEIAAGKFAALARDLRAKGHAPDMVAHFINRLIFCMFAEDIGLLPGTMFTRMLEAAKRQPAQFEPMARQLFDAMRTGGMVGFETIAWFNGGLFDDDLALVLSRPEIELALDAAAMDWSEIDPSVMGTLFERGLDPDKRSQLGAHYTDREKIMQIIEPVIARPLRAEWEAVRAKIADAMSRAKAAADASEKLTKEAQLLPIPTSRMEHAKATGSMKAALTRNSRTITRERNRADTLFRGFLERLRTFKVLDPACGSGNFLYLALQTLKDLELQAMIEAEALGLPREFPGVGPEQLLGIEINPYAAELARVSVWIGEIQWMQRHGFSVSKNPILRPLDTIACRDALFDVDGSDADWPVAEAIVGNPPFLGGKLLRDGLGDSYVDRMFATFRGRVPAEADLVCYWFAKAGEQVEVGGAGAVGMVATNSIRGGANRKVLDRIATTQRLYEAWADEAWVVDGASVRVSLVAFTTKAGMPCSGARLNGEEVEEIYSDLTARRAGRGVDLTKASRLPENGGIAFMGDTKGGAFDIPGDLARPWLRMPANPNGRYNADVLRPWANGLDVTRRPRDMWIIDFGWEMNETEAAFFEEPYRYASSHVRPARVARQAKGYAKAWWRHERPRPEMWRALEGCERAAVTPRVAKHRLFAWHAPMVVPDSQLIVIARSDDTTFGILQSRIHEMWALRLGTSLEDRPRYTPSTTFETFPFPEGLTPNISSADYRNDPRARRIADAARRLNEWREAWLNPTDLVVRVPEVVPGYPDRILPVDEAAAKELRKRTLTNLYNQRPAWLDNAHRALDEAVAAAYGWPADLDEEEVLRRLLELNRQRAAAQE
ncbi:class I SAM-dependent DNA methyltransferase [Geminicoccaceae bacterium 1502E]|nr:class I SAM-dependent DNA methyltransferase [Geminicoccaceae bacterium 1502E]